MLAERCCLCSFLAKWEAILIDDWQVRRRLNTQKSHISQILNLG